MAVMVFPNKIEGKVNAIPSKAHAHRLIIGAALSQRETLLSLEQSSVDIETTIQCLRAIGADIEEDNFKLHINPIKAIAQSPILNFKGEWFYFKISTSSSSLNT